MPVPLSAKKTSRPTKPTRGDLSRSTAVNRETDLAFRLAEALVRRDRSETEAVQIALHMTDWLDDLDDLQALFSKSGRLPPARVERVLVKFLTHVPNHIAAARVLMTGLPVAHIFEVGAVEAPTPPRKHARAPRK